MTDHAACKQLLEELAQKLSALEEASKKRLISAPEGSLRISPCNGTDQYFFRKQPSDRTGSYIPAKNQVLAKRLAQKGYDEKLLRIIQKEQKAIASFLKVCPDYGPEDLYLHLSESRQKLIIPAEEPDELFRRRWETQEYEKKSFQDDAPVLLTSKGERVRSKSEIIIANLIAQQDIPYRYEYPIRLKGLGTVHPDFTLLHVHQRKEFYWEHFGMMDNPEYAENAIRKIAAYYRSGLYPGDRLIMTFETMDYPLNVREVRDMLVHYFS